MNRKEQEKSEAQDLVHTIKVLGVILLAVVILFLVFAEVQIVFMGTIISGQLSFLGIVLGFILKRPKHKELIIN